MAKTRTADASTSTDDLFAGYTPEERAELLALTGQNANLKGDKVPIIKVNYCDIEDKDGNSIKKGNYVYNQNSKEVTDGDEIKVEYIGVDLGKNPEITILAYRNQYAYYNEDAKQRCSSQIFGVGETPVGSTLKYECRAKTCPRRQEGIDKKDKCSCQYLVMVKVNIDGEAKPAMMYVKGKSFSTFSDFLKSIGNTPIFFAPTRLSTKMEKQGSVTYFVAGFEHLSPFTQLEQRENVLAVRNAIEGLEAFKQAALANRAPAQLVDKSTTGTTSRALSSVVMDDDDDIVFDD